MTERRVLIVRTGGGVVGGREEYRKRLLRVTKTMAVVEWSPAVVGRYGKPSEVRFRLKDGYPVGWDERFDPWPLVLDLESLKAALKAETP